MKRLITIGMLLFLGSFLVYGIAPYLRIATLNLSMSEARTKVKTVLMDEGYEILGEYQPGKNPDLYVVAFTGKEIRAVCAKVRDRGLLAAAMKVGFQQTGGRIEVSVLNPEYLFYAYFRDQMDDPSFKEAALKISEKAKSAMGGIGTEMTPFGGDVPIKDLKKYKYMAGMPKFDSPIELAEFGSFDEAVSTIEANLSKGVGSTVKVFEILKEEEQIAVFGVGLHDQETGEANFLPIIGEDHIAAMPYEIIVQGNEVTMLHGRFRFASHWPELTMKTFTKIMSSPGDVKDTMKLLVE